MNWLVEPFGYQYMLNAMWVSAMVGGLCAFLSCYLMLKGWLKRDTENAKTGQRKYEKTIFRILCVKPPISGGFLSMFKPLLKPFESALQSISSQELALSFRAFCIDVSVTSCATEYLYNLSEIPVAFRTPLA